MTTLLQKKEKFSKKTTNLEECETKSHSFFSLYIEGLKGECMNLLIEKAISGDKDAFGKIISQYEKKLYIIAKSRINNEEDVKDIIQETIMNAYINLKTLKDIEKFNSWITTILINTCNKFYTKNNINVVSYDGMVENSINLACDQDTEGINNYMDFAQIIGFLEVEDRTIITMYYMEDYTTKEIGEIFNINESTLRSRISRIRERIKQNLNERSDYNDR